jgi:large subunit ribosomal protein L17
MRHKRAGLHLSRTSAHRKALFSNMVAALLTYERIRTTLVKAKEIRRLAERVITWARRLGPILTKKPEKRTDEERARVVHAMRMALRVVRDRDAVLKLFDEIGPRFLTRHGGYTRVMKTDQRHGDAAPMALLELLPDEGTEAPPKTPSKGSKEAKEPKPAAEGKGKGKGKAAAGSAEVKAPRPAPKVKAKAPAAPKAKKDAGRARAPAKPAATMKRSGRSRGGGE